MINTGLLRELKESLQKLESKLSITLTPTRWRSAKMSAGICQRQPETNPNSGLSLKSKEKTQFWRNESNYHRHVPCLQNQTWTVEMQQISCFKIKRKTVSDQQIQTLLPLFDVRSQSAFLQFLPKRTLQS